MKMMKPVVIFLAVSIFSIAAFAQTQTAASPSEKARAAKPLPIPKETLSAIRERGKLRACVSPYAPWVMIGEQGNLSGYSIDIAKQLAKDLVVEVEFVQAGYPDLLPELVDGNCDVIPAGLSPTPDRALFIHFSDPVAEHGIFVLADKKASTSFQKIEDLNQSTVTIGAVAGSAELEDARRIFSATKVVDLPAEADLTEALLEGKVQAIVAASPLPEILMRNMNDRFYLPMEKPISERGEAFAVRRGDLELLAYLNTWIQAHRYDDWLQNRSDYWFTNLTWMK
jgi:polar amino acid transport system substrate-binding protein